MELVPGTRHLALMNCLLHGMEGDEQGVIHLGNTLGSAGKDLPSSKIILSNPPFGTAKGGGGPTRDDFTHSTSNKQLAFVQHIYRHLKDGGRAAVVLPDNVLFEAGVGADIRRDLMDKCNLHTILRLPTGIFYAQGVKTNVLFFTRGENDKGNTKEVWVYDLRANAPAFGKRTQLTREYFADFVKTYGSDPLGEPEALKKRKDQGEAGRFRKFTRRFIADRADSLDISWLKDESEGEGSSLGEPAEYARHAMAELEGAFEDLKGILAELGEDVEEVEV